MRDWVLFDWGNTLMRALDYPGPMFSWPQVEALPGALDMMRTLDGRIGIALATNAEDSQEQEIWKALALVGLDRHVERIFCYRSVGHKKSSPPFFAHVMNQLDLPADRLIMVGDDFGQDVTAANAVGIKAVWFNEKSDETKNGDAFRTIHHLAELPAQLMDWGYLTPGKA